MKLPATLLSLAAALLPLSVTAEEGAGYPTIDRVEYVLGCMRDMTGPGQESLYKCSCVIDQIAKVMPYEEYVTDSTAVNAFSIGGERGEVMRAYTGGRAMAKRFRSVQAEARKACFLP